VIFTNEDCMELMARYPDKHFDLAIVDPPYGISDFSPDAWHGRGKLRDRAFKRLNSTFDKIKPNKEYFMELFRVSKNQIIFGGNYFELPPTRGIIFWDKMQPWKNFSQFEYAWSSFNVPAKKIELTSAASEKIHPTQKPIALYKWLLLNYAKPGDLILDTHVGSASSLIACEELGFDYVGCELDADYYRAACERIEKYRSQPQLFAGELHVQNKQKLDNERGLYEL